MMNNRTTRNFAWSDQDLALATDAGFKLVERQSDAAETSLGAF